MSKIDLSKLVLKCRDAGWPDAEILEWLCRRKELAEVRFPGVPRRYSFVAPTIKLEGVKGSEFDEKKAFAKGGNTTTQKERSQYLINKAKVHRGMERDEILTAIHNLPNYGLRRSGEKEPHDTTILRHIGKYARKRKPRNVQF
jgi:hypothetical protein